mmetsp:Transcript_26643/g.57894  ORF Transcript_26643/g.57894 Transcript_26643/m.57894 type:complete len:1023 (-) Transcript_26643:20-3088(-)
MARRCKDFGKVGVQIALAVVLDIGAAVVLGTKGMYFDFALFVVRMALLLSSTIVAIRCGSPRSESLSARQGEAELPLALHDHHTHAHVHAGHSNRGQTDVESQAVGRSLDLELAARRAAMEGKEQHKWKADVVLAILFILITIESVITGAQISGLQHTNRLVAVALCVSVFAMNAEAFLLKKLVTKMLSEEGELFPHLHEHPLHYKSTPIVGVCSVCRETFGTATGGHERWECHTCLGEGVRRGFRMCSLCYRKQLAKDSVQEGLLRGDRGPKPSLELGPSRYLARTAALAAPFRCNLIAALACIVISTVASVLLPNQQGKVINTLVNDDPASFRGVLESFVFLSVVGALFKSMMSLTVNIVSRQLTLGIRSDMFKSIMKQDMAFFDGMMTGQLTSRMTNDVNAVTQPIVQILTVTLANLITLIGGSIMCFYTSWRLTMLALTMIGPVIYLTGIYAAWSKSLNARVRAALGDSNAVATESLRNIRTVRSFGASGIETDVFEGHVGEAWRNMRKDAYASAGVGAISGYVNFAAGVLVYWYGGQAVLSGTDEQLNIGNLITFNMYWGMLGSSINALNSTLNTIVVAASAAKRVFEIIDLDPDIPIDDSKALSLESVISVGSAPSIEFKNVQFTYQMRPDKQIFTDLSFTIPSGSTVAFVGKSGCGKSTTMQLLLRFYDPQKGQVLVEGQPLTAYNLRSYQRRIAVVSQETQVFARSVKENLTYGMKPGDYNDEMIEAAAKQANAHDFIMAMDRGYDSMLGESGGRLSGGQKQRLSIARAFLRRPQLLLLDEATSALDTENERQIQKALDDMVEAMAGSVSVVIIAHRLSTVMNADKIIVINEGKVAEEGDHSKLMREDGIYASLVKRQEAREAEKEGEEAKENKSKGTDLAVRNAANDGQTSVVPCSFRCAPWANFHTLTNEEKKDKVQLRLRNVMQRALQHAGTDAVSDAFMECLREAFEDERRKAEMRRKRRGADTDDEELSEVDRVKGAAELDFDREEPSDSIASLFREVQRKAKLEKKPW